MKPGVSYDTIKGSMQTYDLLLFRGTDFVSNSIAKVEKQRIGSPKVNAADANYTHAAIVIKGCDLMPLKTMQETNWLKPDWLYVFESTMSGKLSDGCPDVNGQSHLGCQLRVLDEVVKSYDKPEDSRMAWCALQSSPSPTNTITPRMIYEKYKGINYDLSAVDLAACAFTPIRRIRDNPVFKFLRDKLCQGMCCCCKNTQMEVSEWQFCSEMVCNIYKDIGIIPSTVDAQNVMPIDFITDASDPKKTLDKDGEIPPLFMNPVRFKYY